MRNELISAVQPISSPQQSHSAKPKYSPPQLPAQTETVFVMRVTREDRQRGSSRLVLSLVSERTKNTAPAIRIRPGMRVKITTLPDLPETAKKGGGNAKK